jgi:carbamoylphosphate synthase large subunit
MSHEQAWLLANAGPLLPPEVRVALAGAAAFQRVQSKIEFARLLDELGLPQPLRQVVQSATDLADLAFPYWLKTAFSAAGQGVREVVDARSRETALDDLLGEAPVMAQQPACVAWWADARLPPRGRFTPVHRVQSPHSRAR